MAEPELHIIEMNGRMRGVNIGAWITTPESPAQLTAKDATAVDTTTYSADEAGVIENNRTRIDEIEAALIANGLLAAP